MPCRISETGRLVMRLEAGAALNSSITKSYADIVKNAFGAQKHIKGPKIIKIITKIWLLVFPHTSSVIPNSVLQKQLLTGFLTAAFGKYYGYGLAPSFAKWTMLRPLQNRKARVK